jgi:SAM-dependent methyltransferase
MHDTAYEIGREFFNLYIKQSDRILEIGSQNVNGTLRDFDSRCSEYVGVDLCPGPGVDIVLTDPYKFPFKKSHFDAVISSSCFEHDQMFWLTFLEMVRVLKPKGYIYINAPSNGNYHRHPVDNWRFYPDAAIALETWARQKGKNVSLVECFTAKRKQDIWNDCVMIFSKKKHNANQSTTRLTDKFPDSVNIRYSSSPSIENLSEETEDQRLLRQARETIDRQKAELASLVVQRDQVAAALGLGKEEAAALRASVAEVERSNSLLQATLVEREVAQQTEVERHAAAEAAQRAEVERHAAAEAAQRAEVERHAAAEAVLATQLDRVTEERQAALADRDRLTGQYGTAMAEMDELRSELAQLATERDRIAAQSERWFNAAVVWAASRLLRAPGLRRRQAFHRLLLRLRARPIGCWINRANHKDSLRAQANRARDAAQWELAARLYVDELHRNAYDPAIWAELGQALKEAGKISAAEIAYRRVAALEKGLAHTKFDQGDLDPNVPNAVPSCFNGDQVKVDGSAT